MVRAILSLSSGFDLNVTEKASVAHLLHDLLFIQQRQDICIQQFFVANSKQLNNKRGIHGVREPKHRPNSLFAITESSIECSHVICCREEAVRSGEGHLPEGVQLVR